MLSIRKIFKTCNVPFLFAWLALPLMADDEPPTYDDPFYQQKGNATEQINSNRVPFFQVNEQIDPFTGNLSLIHTDVSLPGNGGLDLNIQRSYNSRIWGRKDTSFPGLVAVNERSIMGIGWSFHFGRIRNPSGSGSNNRFLPDNPIFELPDGSTHQFYKDKSDTSRMISREFWLYKRTNTSPLEYQLKMADGTLYTFSQNNRYLTRDGVTILQVKTIETPNGNIISFIYDSTDARKIMSITDTVGRVVTFTYSSYGGNSCSESELQALDSVVVNGHSYSYTYEVVNCNLFLVKATSPNGLSWQYSYYQLGKEKYELDELIYPSGGRIKYKYDDVIFDTGSVSIPFTVVEERILSGRGLTPSTQTYSYEANSSTNQITTIDWPGCKKERYTYYGFGPLPNQGLSNNLWRLGRMLKKEILFGNSSVRTEVYNWSEGTIVSNDSISNGNWNGTIGYLYDNMIIIPRLDSTVIYQGGNTYSTIYSDYDSYGNPKLITKTGDITQVITLTYYYDTDKNIVKNRPLTRRISMEGQSVDQSFKYDSSGNLERVNLYGAVTDYSYIDGNITSKTNARGITTSFHYDQGVIQEIINPIYSISRIINWDGTIDRETNGRGFSTSFSYDHSGRLTKINTPVELDTDIIYENNGGTYWRIQKGPWFKQFNVDGIGRVTSTSSSENIKARTNYDTCGRVNYQSYPFTSIDIGDVYSYDALDRILNVTHPDNTNRSFTYLSDDVEITNERGVSVRYNYDTFGSPENRRIERIIDTSGATTYTHNALGQVTSINSPESINRIFSYNENGFLDSETHPETGTITYGRDEIGNRISRTYGEYTTNYIYDDLSRLEKIDFDDGAIDDVIFSYDNSDNRESMNTGGMLWEYSYDQENRLSQQDWTRNNRLFTTSYSYDARGNLEFLIYPTQKRVLYTYDNANRIKTVDGYISDINYHPSGKMENLVYSNGKSTTLSYDERYRTESIFSSLIMDMIYSYDEVGNVLDIDDELNPNRSRTMLYDDLDRLDSASGLWGNLSYTYDAVGNRTSKTYNGNLTSYDYSTFTKRITSIAGAEEETLLYDSMGNITFLKGNALSYDSYNRLRNIGNGTVTYEYDGDNKRVAKINNHSGLELLYHYGASDNVLAETDMNGVMKAEYIYVNGQLIAQVLPQADLIIESLTYLPVSPFVNDSVTISIVVKNQGDALASSTELTVLVGVEGTSTTYSLPAIEPGESFTLQHQTVFNHAVIYPLTVTVDVGDSVIEENEANNVKVSSISVLPNTSGEQNALVIRVHFPDIATSTTEAGVVSKVEEMAAWIEETSWGVNNVTNIIRGPVTLTYNSNYYDGESRNPLVEMTQEVISKLLSEEPNILDSSGQEIERIILITNSDENIVDLATTGAWPYEVNNETRYLSVSIHSIGSTTPELSHGFAHQLGMVDLYEYENVSFPYEYANGWDNMSKPFNGAHPLVWSKESVAWVSSYNAKVLYVPRPQPGSTWNHNDEPIVLSFQETALPSEIIGIAFGLTNGINSITDETNFYYVEARRNDEAGGSDHNVIPETGVLVYNADNLTSEGEGPVAIRYNHNISSIDEAALGVDESISLPDVGIALTVKSDSSDQRGYEITAEYSPPSNNYNVYIHQGNRPWSSPDIWVDNQRDGGGYQSYNAIEHLSPGPIVESPIANEQNRVFARVHNSGPATAYGVKVKFQMSEPYHTIGGEAAFDERALRIIDEIPSGQYRDVFFTWTPEGVEEPHNCVRVEIYRALNDSHLNDNAAQQNMNVVSSDRSSPYDPVTFNFQISHDLERSRLYYFREEGIPGTWSKDFQESKRLVQPGEKYIGTLTVQPPLNAQVCSNHEIHVTAWTPRGDTIVPVGGTTLNTKLRNRTEVTLIADIGTCKSTNNLIIKEAISSGDRAYMVQDHKKLIKNCASIQTSGCTAPARINEKFFLRYKDPAGNPVYHEVTTDGHGCFNDSYDVIEGGEWVITGYYPGNDCFGSANTDQIINVPLEQSHDQDYDGLLDEDEVQGDADGDGIQNHLDQDSDNDGVSDGNESIGDSDQDGLENVVDPDSDNDGYLDGYDAIPFMHQWELDFFYGYLNLDSALPIIDDNLYGVRVGYIYDPIWSFEVEIAKMSTNDRLGVSGNVIQTNFNTLYHFQQRSSGVIPFLMAGVGGISYNGFNDEDKSFAMNIGLGLKVPFSALQELGLPNHKRWSIRWDARIFIGTDAYNVDTYRNFQTTIGINYRF